MLVGVFFIEGCSYKITDIDTSSKDQQCVRECSKTYSYAISQGNQIGFKTETLSAAKDAYSVCINTCPNQ
jgi:hypothetical protein